MMEDLATQAATVEPIQPAQALFAVVQIKVA
jgi:hypothetical protein